MSTLTIPNTAVDGNDILASEYNANFNAVSTFLNSTGVNVYQAGTVDSTALASNAVTTAKITDANVTYAKLDSSTVGPYLLPSGMVAPYAGSAAPTGWLLCYGQNVSRATYAALFTAIGTTYGTGDGSTTFGLPDLRGRVAAGKDDMGGSAASRLTNSGSGITGTGLGNSGGAETVTLATNQLPSHTHAVGTRPNDGAGLATGSVPYVNEPLIATGGGAGYTSGGTGSGAAHNNTQPTLILNYIIKT